MLSRKIIRSIAPSAFKFYKSTVRCFNITPASTLPPLPCSARIITVRFYSQEANAENLPVVDFDHVKRATLQNDVMIIDVREPDEIKEHGKIPNSVNIPLGSIDTKLGLSEKEFQQTYNRSKPKENTELIFYCMIGKRSSKAQQSAHNLGFKNTKNYLGSWTDWAANNQ